MPRRPKTNVPNKSSKFHSSPISPTNAKKSLHLKPDQLYIRKTPRTSTHSQTTDAEYVFRVILLCIMDESDPNKLTFVSSEFEAQVKQNPSMRRYFSIVNHPHFQVLMQEYCANIWDCTSTGIDVKKHLSVQTNQTSESKFTRVFFHSLTCMNRRTACIHGLL